MPALVLGPLLRYVDATSATVWVETDSPCTVSVLGGSTPTFAVAGHHYALVVVPDLAAGTVSPYSVSLDGTQVWPEPGSPFPPSTIRTRDPEVPLRLAFGSCRKTAPHRPPYSLDVHEDPRGAGVDALYAYAVRLMRNPGQPWPDALLLLGDQVYADELSPETLTFIQSRRDIRVPPGEEIADFEEYTRLYREAWSEPTIRWLLSTVSSAMIFDDHDVHDDWNTSQSWRRDKQATDWWQERVIGALSAYWVYQHLGNLSVKELEQDALFARVRAVGDADELLRAFAADADREADGEEGTRWSYRRDFGPVRLLVLDSRCGRVLAEGRRSMVDTPEWSWVEDQLASLDGCDHVLLASSLPYLLPPAIHHLEGWNEAVCAGAWGPAAARLGERIRRGVDLEHWAAFRRTFDALAELVTQVASGRRGPAPATVVFLSGDVHFSYLAGVHFPPSAQVTSAVYQAVCSPLRNPLKRGLRVADRFTRTRAGQLIGRAVARSAGVHDPEMTWSVDDGPWFDNAVATLEIHGRAAALLVERTRPDDGGPPRFEQVLQRQLSEAAAASPTRPGTSAAGPSSTEPRG